MIANKLFDMQKKGRIRIFKIMIMAVLAFGLFVFSIGKAKEVIPESTSKNNTNIDAINPVEQCIKETTLNGVFFNSLQGGYFDVPEPYVGNVFLNIPIYGKAGKYSVPDTNTYQKQLGLFIAKNLNDCLKMLYNETIGENISTMSTTHPDVKINKAGYIDVSLMLNVSNHDKKEHKVEKTTTRVNSEYHKFCELATKFIEMQKQDPNVIMFSDMVNFAEANKITISYFESPENFKKIIFVLEDKNYLRKDIGTYNYLFALEYDW